MCSQGSDSFDVRLDKAQYSPADHTIEQTEEEREAHPDAAWPRLTIVANEPSVHLIRPGPGSLIAWGVCRDIGRYDEEWVYCIIVLDWRKGHIIRVGTHASRSDGSHARFPPPPRPLICRSSTTRSSWCIGQKTKSPVQTP